MLLSTTFRLPLSDAYAGGDMRACCTRAATLGRRSHIANMHAAPEEAARLGEGAFCGIFWNLIFGTLQESNFATACLSAKRSCTTSWRWYMSTLSPKPCQGRGGRSYDSTPKDTTGEVSQEIEAFMETKPSQEEIIKWSLSDQCTRKDRHIVVNTNQPFDAAVWSYQAQNCKGQVSDQLRRRLIS